MLKSIAQKQYLLKPDKSFIKHLRRIIGFNPKNYKLYQLACIHKSSSFEIFKDVEINNERLEYLGDAILDAVVGEYLFQRFPDKDVGFLTQMRSKIVNRDNLNNIAIKLGISKYGFMIFQHHFITLLHLLILLLTALSLPLELLMTDMRKIERL